MVQAMSIVCMSFSLLAAFGFPIGLAVYMYRKERISLKALLVGVLVFTVFQFLTRIPLLSFLSGMDWYRDLVSNLLFGAFVIGGLTAGLFEETGRYLGFRFFLKKELSWKNGIAFGIGHGGIEAIGLVGLTYINNIVISIMINTGMFDSLIAPQIGSEAATQVKSQLVELPPAIFLIGGLERIFAVIVQIALSLIVLYGVMNRKIIYLFAAILAHTLLNAPGVIIVQQGYSVWLAELYIFIFAAVAAYFIIRSRPFFERIPGENLK